jgi:hypothetical protein
MRGCVETDSWQNELADRPSIVYSSSINRSPWTLGEYSRAASKIARYGILRAKDLNFLYSLKKGFFDFVQPGIMTSHEGFGGCGPTRRVLWRRNDSNVMECSAGTS